MKTTVGVRHHPRNTQTRELRILSATGNEGKKKGSPLKEATKSHSKPLPSHREPLLEKKKRATIVIWSLAKTWTSSTVPRGSEVVRVSPVGDAFRDEAKLQAGFSRTWQWNWEPSRCFQTLINSVLG